MTEIPEHLLKRAQAARDKAATESGAGDSASGATSDSRIPDDLLNRSKAASSGVAVAERVATGVATTAPNGNAPLGTGPGGHTQRLLTVVKSGSIQDVKAVPVDKVHTWPHLLGPEFVASLACTAFLFMFSWFVNAPLLQAANFNQTPNPSKAPWYFLGLQELLTLASPRSTKEPLTGLVFG